MRLLKKWGAIALSAATAVSMMSGCDTLEEKTESNTVAATFDDKDIMLDYVMLQMRFAQYDLERMYSSFYGTTDFWKQAYSETQTVEQSVIESVLQSIRQAKVLCDYAEKNQIALTEEQKTLVDEAVAKTLENETYVSAIGITEKLLREIYTESALANAVYLELVKDVDTTIGEDEFIKKNLTYVKLTPSDLEEASSAETMEEAESTEPVSETETSSETVSDEETTVEGSSVEETFTETASAEETSSSEAKDAEAEETTLSAEEEKQLEEMDAAAKEIKERLEAGELAADFVSEYNEDSTYFTATQSTSTIGEDSTFSYTEAAFKLATGESVIYENEADGSVYVILCTNDNDEAARQSAIDSEMETRKAALFAEKYVEIQAESPKFSVDEDVIGQIQFSVAVYVPETEEETTEDLMTEQEETTEAEIVTEEETTEAVTEAEETTTVTETQEETTEAETK